MLNLSAPLPPLLLPSHPPGDGRVQRGLSFFDGRRRAVPSLDLSADTSREDCRALVRRLSLGEPADPERKPPAPVPSPALQAWPGTARLHDRFLADTHAAGMLERLEAQGQAQRLGCDAVLDVLQLFVSTRLPLRVGIGACGMQVDWSGALVHATEHQGVAIARSADFELRWCESRTGQQAWLLNEASATGLAQSLAMLSPDGEVRLLLAPIHDPARPQPCAWRSAVHAACGGQRGSAC